MNSTQLKCFLEVAKELNFARAAENLHFSQPTVSKQIQSLENELHARLFIRSTRSVELTQAGKLFFPNARSIYIQEMDAIRTIAKLDMEVDPHLTIGTYGMEVFRYMKEFYPKLTKQFPAIQPDVVFAPYQSLSSSLRANSIDVIIGSKEMMEVQSPSLTNFTKLADAPITFILPSHAFDDAFDGSLPLSLKSPEDVSKLLDAIRNSKNIHHRVSVSVLETVLRSRLNIYDIAENYADEDMQYCDNIESAFLQVTSGNAFIILGEPVVLRNPALKNYVIEYANSMTYGYFCNAGNTKDSLKYLKKELADYFDAS